MAKDKKSFILYADQTGLFEKLTDAKAGKLIKYIFDYVNDKDPSTDDILLQVAFEPIKQQLKRDLRDWEDEKVNRSEAGNLGNLKRWKPDLYDKVINGKMELNQAIKIAKDRTATNGIANIADNVNVTVNVNDTVKKERERGFAPPAKEDVIELMFEKLDEFSAMGEADKFINFYQSKNWYVGKTKMKDWRAAARGWISRMNDFKNEKNGQRKQGTSEARVEATKNF